MNSEKTTPTTRIIYLSGAGLSATIWDSVRKKVASEGYVPAYDRSPTQSLKEIVQEVLQQIQKLDTARYIVVAHSLGGIIGVEVARALGDKLAGFIAISATIPEPGKSFVSTLPFPQNVIMPLIVKVAGTKPPASAIRKSLCSDLSDLQSADIIAAFSPEPRRVYTDTTSSTPMPATNYLYICSLSDKQTAPSSQTKMAQRLPAATVADINSGHLAMISHPDEVAALINDFVGKL